MCHVSSDVSTHELSRSHILDMLTRISIRSVYFFAQQAPTRAEFLRLTEDAAPAVLKFAVVDGGSCVCVCVCVASTVGLVPFNLNLALKTRRAKDVLHD